MKNILIKIISLALIFSFSSCSSLSPATEAMLGKQAPNTRFTMLEDGEYVSIRSFYGKTTVLVFWATWCSNSKAFMKDFSQFTREHQRSDVKYLAVSIDDPQDKQTLQNMVYLQGLDTMDHAYSGNAELDEAFLTFRLIAVPTIIILSPDGKVKDMGNSMSVVERNIK